MKEWDTAYFRKAGGSRLKDLLSLSPSKSLGAIALEWLAIVFCVWLHLTFPYKPVYLFCLVIIGSRLYALYSLLHDCLHYLIVRNRKWNDRIGQLFLAFPLFISLPVMRKHHFNHHKFLNTDQDPEMAHLNYDEFQFPKSRWQLFMLYFLDVTGVHFVYYRLLKIRNWLSDPRRIIPSNAYSRFNAALYILLALAAIYLGFWRGLLLYWVLPYATVYQLLNRIRLTTEHFNLGSDSGYETRSVNLSRLEGAFMSPHNLGFHTEHHMFPAVPFYNLKRLHTLLREEDIFREQELVDNSYIQVIKKCLKPPHE